MASLTLLDEEVWSGIAFLKMKNILVKEKKWKSMKLAEVS
jgi:hypothetical protein